MAGAIEPVVRPALIDEFKRVLREKFATYIPSEDVDGYVEIQASSSHVHPDPQDPSRICRDPRDDYLFALAVESGVSLVSTNRDIPETADPPCRVLGIGDLLREVRRSE